MQITAKQSKDLLERFRLNEEIQFWPRFNSGFKYSFNVALVNDSISSALNYWDGFIEDLVIEKQWAAIEHALLKSENILGSK